MSRALERDPPWLRPSRLVLASLLLSSHQRAFGHPLLAGAGGEHPRLRAQELFAAATVVLAHDGADPGGDPGPRLVYANRAALQLWWRPWAELVGMPSRLTAEPAERASRAQALGRVQAQHAIANYSGIRIDSRGRRFQIRGARVWTLWGEDGQPCGQAAAFDDWWWL